jgi:hypothetical protein
MLKEVGSLHNSPKSYADHSSKNLISSDTIWNINDTIPMTKTVKKPVMTGL